MGEFVRIDGGAVTYRILIIDNHLLTATGLQVALRERGWRVEVTNGPTVEAVLELSAAFRPDCVLLDLNLGELGSGLELIPLLRKFTPSVLMLTAETDRSILAAGIEAGAAGWVSKGNTFETLIGAVQAAPTGRDLLGRSSRDALLEELRLHRSATARVLAPLELLSQREKNVLGALIDGLSCEEIASSHFVSVTTVRSQIRSILQKLGVSSQLAAVAMANRAGWKSRSEERVAEQVGKCDRSSQVV
jgi:DNA-binding NarL/FixJ family response regulator